MVDDTAIILGMLVLALLPPVVRQALLSRGHAGTGPGRVGTVVILVIDAVLAVTILWFVPGAPPVHWALPSLVEVVLIATVAPALFIVGALVGVIFLPFDVDPSIDVSTDGSDAHAALAYTLIAVVLVGPAEELLFRGLILPLLIDAVGLVAGLVLMGVLFGLYHYPNVADTPVALDGDGAATLAVSGLGGILLGWYYLYSANLVVPVIGHSIHVAILFFVIDR